MPEPLPPAPPHDDWLTPGRFAALLALLVFVAYPQVVLGLETFVYRDFGYFSYPIAFHLRESLWHGEFPLWNPLSNCGIPFLAQWNTQALYPPALFYLIFPLSWALPVFCLLHLYLGGLGMFFLARRWTGCGFAAAFAGIVFAFSGLMLNSLMWPATIPGFGWMPWVVLLAERAWREGGRMIIMAALIGALQMLSGAVEVILITWVLLGAMCLQEFSHGKRPRWRTLWRAGLVVLLVALLSAVQLLPFLDFVNHSHRQQNFAAAIWPMPVTGWANLLAPLFLTHRSYHGPFTQAEQGWTSSYYVGGLTVALAVWAVWRTRDRRVWLLAGLALLCLVLALGDATPLYSWLNKHVSIIGMMRFPVKFVILPGFALPLLAALALAELNRRGARRTWGIVAGGTLALLFGLAWFAWRLNDKPADGVDTGQNTLLHALGFVALSALLFFAGRAFEPKRRCLLQLSVLMLAWLDVSHYGPLPQWVAHGVYQPELPRSLPAPRFGLARAMISNEGVTEFSRSVIPEPDKDYISRRFALFSNCNLLEGFSKTDGFFALHVRDHKLFAQLLYDAESAAPTSEALLDFLGVSQITTPGKIFEWTPRPTFMPLITGGQKPVFDGEAPTMRFLASSNFNPRTEVYLLREARALVTATNAVKVTISAAHFAANHIEADVLAAESALVVVAQTFYHPWRAYVDGKPTPLLRANLGFQAFQVPAGPHAVRLVYEDIKFQYGAAISLVTLLGSVASWFTLCRPKPIAHDRP